eukprot:c36738_g1_i1 orf=3-188(-)
MVNFSGYPTGKLGWNHIHPPRQPKRIGCPLHLVSHENRKADTSYHPMAIGQLGRLQNFWQGA